MINKYHSKDLIWLYDNILTIDLAYNHINYIAVFHTNENHSYTWYSLFTPDIESNKYFMDLIASITNAPIK